MARMLPAAIDPSTTSPGEKQMFERLEKAPGTAGWTVLHSLSLPRHIRQTEGEVDFVIVVPGVGVLCLEVKAHKRVRRDPDGMWHLGSDPPSARSPFRQASDAMHSLRNELTRQAPALRTVPFTSAVAFTHTDCDLMQSTEWHSWQLLDARAILARPIDVNVLKILASARDHYRSVGKAWLASSAEPTDAQTATIVSKLRPSFDLIESRKVVRARTRDELLRFTEEQYDALDSLASAQRLHFNGPAGTGKTLLAMEAARRAAASGARVLLVCFNRPLADWLQEQAEAHATRYEVRTFHSHLMGIAGRPKPGPTPSWWSNTLPDLALERLLTAGPTHDVLVVDEAQDLLSANYLDCMDATIHGGLAGSRWMLFSDLERQALYDGGGDVEALAQRAPDTVRFNLLTNCRNTPSIAEYTRAVAGMESGYRRIRRPENGFMPRMRFYATPTEEGHLLADIFSDLRKTRFEPADVAILSPTRDNASITHLPPTEPWVHRIDTVGTGQRGWAQARTVHSYKGLEAPVIILTGVEDVTSESAQSMLYVALSRPTERLFVLADERVKPILQELVTARLFGTEERA